MRRFSNVVKKCFQPDFSYEKDNIVTNIFSEEISSVDLRDYCPQTIDIHDTASPMINVVLRCIETMVNLEIEETSKLNKNKKKNLINSNFHNLDEEFAYYQTIKKNSSKKFSYRDVLKFFSKYDIKYDIKKYARLKGTGYDKVKSFKEKQKVIDLYKKVLTNKIPIISAIHVSKNLEISKTGECTKDTVIFKFPVLIVGFNDFKKSFIFQNCWGKNWGDKGFGYIPYKIFKQNRILDSWIILSCKSQLDNKIYNYPNIDNSYISVICDNQLDNSKIEYSNLLNNNNNVLSTTIRGDKEATTTEISERTREDQ